MTEEGEKVPFKALPVGKREIASTWRIQFDPIVEKEMLTLIIRNLPGKFISIDGLSLFRNFFVHLKLNYPE